VLTEGTA